MAFNAGEIVIELTARDGGFSASVKNAGTLLRQFKVDAEQTAKSVKRLEEHQFSLGTQFRNIVLTLGNLRFAMMDINDVFLRLPASILKSAGALEQTQAMLTGLSTKLTKVAREADGAANFQFITNMAQKAPFEIAALANSFVKLKSAGIDPTRGSMQTLIDSVARFGGDSQTLQRASVAIQQMAGKGVISMEELRQQLGEAVPTAMRDMAIGMSLSMAQLTNAVSKGTVESTSALNKMFVVMNLRNRGAALELMDTWNGALAQLKTRWELAAKDVYDAGFGKAVRDVVGQISGGLQSNEFKRFSLEVGQGLGSAVRTVSDFAKTMYELGGVIKVVALAWLSYKVASNFIVPTFGALSKTAKGLVQDYTTLSQRARANAAEMVAGATAEARASMTSADAAVAASRYKIQQIEAEILAHKRLSVELASQRARALEANATSYGRRNGIADPNTGAVVAPSTRLASIAVEAQANQRALQVLEGQLSSATVAHQTAATAAAGHAAKVAAIEGGALAAGRGMTALAAAGRMASTAFNALGGWATVLNIAIAAGAYVWATWETAADKAAKAGERALRAQKGLSDKSDLDSAKSNLESATTEMERAQASYNAAISSGMDKGSVMQRERFKFIEKNLKDSSARVASLKAEITAADKALTERNGRDVAGIMTRASDNVTDAITAASQRKLIAIDEAYAAESKAAANDPKLEAAASARRGDASKQVVLSDAQQRLAALKAAATTVTTQAKNVGTEAASLAIKELNSKILAAQADVDNALEALKPNRIVAKEPKGDKKGGATILDPLQDLIDRLSAKNADLAAQLDGFALGRTADKIEGARAKIQAMADAGRLDYKVGKKSFGPGVVAIEVAKEMAAQEELQKQTISDAEKFTNFMQALGPKYESAMMLLVDPLAAVADKEETKTARMLNKLSPERLAALASALGTTVETIKSSLGKSMVVDASGDFAGMGKEAEAIERRLTVKTEAENKARQMADLETFRMRQQNRIDDILLEQGYSQDVMTMENNLQKLISAKTREINEKPLTAMQQLQVEWADTTKAMDQATSSWANSAVDAFVDSARTGKLQWKGLVESILADMLKIQIKKGIGGLLSGAMGGLGKWFSGLVGFADGGIMTSSGSVPLRAYAAGGIAKSPQMALYGEGSMAEAYVPLPDGRSIPVTMAGGGQMPSVTVNVINQSGTQVTAKQSQPRMDGKQMILDVVLQGMSTPGPFRDSMKSIQGQN